MRLIICGFGRVGEAHGAYYAGHPRVRVVGVVDPCAARRAQALEAFPGAVTAASPDACEVAADVADIASPPAFHADQALHWLERGVDVLCEKPAVLDPAEGAALARLADRTGRVLHPGHNYLFSPPVKFLKETLRHGALGRVTELSVTIERRAPALGVAEWNPGWRAKPGIAGGGILLDHGTHWIYVLLHLLGVPRTVRCAMTMRAGVEHAAHLIVGFPDGIRANVRATWLAERRATSIVVRGDDAELTIRDGRATLLSHCSREDFAVGDTDGPQIYDAWFPESFAAFERHRAAGRGASREWNYALAAARIVHLARASYRANGTEQPCPTNLLWRDATIPAP